MDIKSEVEQLDNEDPKRVSAMFGANIKRDTRLKSTFVDNSEYKDIVTELVDWKRFIKTIEKGGTTQMGSLINETKIRVTQIRDEKGFTLLHHAVHKMKPDIV
jgi:hypothetical protein